MHRATIAGWCSRGAAAILFAMFQPGTHASAAEATYPRFKVDPAWPAVLPDNYLLGNVGGLAVDAQDHVWILSRPKTLQKSGLLGLADEPPTAECCRAAPPVIEFDADGRYVRGWGGRNDAAGYQWPENEHGITVDTAGHVWICGNGPNDNHCLKFTRTGQFLLQIGKSAQSTGSLDVQNLNQATQVQVWPDTNEAFIADGYMNRRVIVFDATTGTFKRMWGAYGNVPDDDAPTTQIFTGPGPRQFALVHGVQIASDGLVYVNDRHNSRIQAFTLDGKFVTEGYVARATRHVYGTTFSSAFSSDPHQAFMYVADSVNSKIRILERRTLREIPSAAFGHAGPYAGQFQGLHVIAVDSKGNLYTSEAPGTTGRVQKFVYLGASR